jgi:hypothetical protein
MKAEGGRVKTDVQKRPIRGVCAVLGLAAALGLGLLTSPQVRAQDQPPPRHFLLHHHWKEGTPPPGKPRCISHTDLRAGYPSTLAGHLEPSNTAGGIGYYVGGGVLFGHGEPKRRDEGTWGWDETGCRLFRHTNVLGWSHGRKHQGGTGAYAVDGHPIPDFAYGTASEFNLLRGVIR